MKKLQSRTTKEKDHGVTIGAGIKVSEQSGIVASNGNQIIRLIRIYIIYRE